MQSGIYKNWLSCIMLFFLLLNMQLHAQVAKDSIHADLYKDTIPVVKKNLESKKITAKKFILPAALFTSGFVVIKISDPNKFDNQISNYVNNRFQNKTFIDNYLQFAPAVATFGLDISGVKSKHNLKEKLVIYALTTALTTAFVQPIKYIVKENRPDNSARNSFPSGHTATTFAAAEFLSMEYGNQSNWYSIAGYTVAATTGALRIYNKKHWLSDVVAGAGVGILSTRLSYLIYPVLKHAIFKTRNFTFITTPYYNEYTQGIRMLIVNSK